MFEGGSKPSISDAEPRRPDYRVVDQPSSGVCRARGQQSTGVKMLEAISKMQLQVERQNKTQKLPRLRLCLSMEILSTIISS